MENKFNNSEQKHFVHVNSTATSQGHTTTNKRRNTSETDSQSYYTPDEFELISSNQEIPSTTSSISIPAENERRCVLHGLADPHRNLVRNIDLPLPGNSNRKCCDRLEVPSDEQDWQDATRIHRFDFVELFRQRMHYERVGIPLTSLELLHMADNERQWRRQCRKQRKYVVHERRCHDRCTQTESLLMQPRPHRLHGGNACTCGLIEAEARKCKLNSQVYDRRGNKMIYEPVGDADGNINPASSQYFEAVPYPPSGSEERSRNAYRTRMEPECYSCCGCQAMRKLQERLNRKKHRPAPAMTAAAAAHGPPTSMKILLPPPALRASHLEHCRSRELRMWRKRREQLILEQDDTEEDRAQSSRRYTYQFPVKYKTRGKHEDHREHKDRPEFSHLLRRSPKTVHLPSKVAAELSSDSESTDDTESNSSSKVQVLLAPGSPRLLLNETEMSGLMKTKSIVLTESSSLLVSEHTLSITNAARLSFEAGGLMHGSADTMNDVWCDPGTFLTTPAAMREWKKHLSIDALTVGSVGAPVLGEQAARAALEKCAYLSREFNNLSREERAKAIATRMQQLRYFQDKASWEYICMIRANEPRNGYQYNYNQAIPRLFNCPLDKPSCVRLLNESILAHFLHVHFSEPGLALNELFERDQVLIMFQPRSFKRSRNICLSMIVYAGAKNKANGLPISSYMLDYNVGLPSKYSMFTAHMPIFVMACRTRRRYKDTNVDLQRRGSSNATYTVRDRHRVGESVMALWLVSVELVRPVHVQMTVFNRRVDISRSSIMQVRGLNKCHDCDKFMSKSKNYLRLTAQDLRLLTNNYKESLYMELSIQDYAHPAARERFVRLR